MFYTIKKQKCDCFYITSKAESVDHSVQVGSGSRGRGIAASHNATRCPLIKSLRSHVAWNAMLNFMLLENGFRFKCILRQRWFDCKIMCFMTQLSGRYSLKMQRRTLWRSASAGGSKLIWTDQQSCALLDVLGTILGPEIDFSPYLLCQKALIQRFYTPTADTFCSGLERVYCLNVIHFSLHF